MMSAVSVALRSGDTNRASNISAFNCKHTQQRASDLFHLRAGEWTHISHCGTPGALVGFLGSRGPYHIPSSICLSHALGGKLCKVTATLDPAFCIPGALAMTH